MPEQAKKPNVVYILADDMGYGDISAFNEKCPFRYGFLTGRYNWRSVLKSEVIGKC